MALTNAEHQRRWRKRNLVSLTADGREIARKLLEMDDRAKLALIVGLLNSSTPKLAAANLSEMTAAVAGPVLPEATRATRLPIASPAPSPSRHRNPTARFMTP
jgi:hypothetical protein